MANAGFYWTEDPKEVFTKGFVQYVAGIEKQIDQLVQQYAPQIENWMKENAPWTDRTGHARQSLRAEIEYDVNELAIYMYYNEVDYDVFLEYANTGRFSILAPAMDYWSPILFKEFKKLVGS
jgi:hypothetical protein